jgi:hypothetical protein
MSAAGGAGVSPRMRRARNREWSCAAVSLVTAAERHRDQARRAFPKERAQWLAGMRALALAARRWPMWRNRQGELPLGDWMPMPEPPSEKGGVE